LRNLLNGLKSKKFFGQLSAGCIEVYNASVLFGGFVLIFTATIRNREVAAGVTSTNFTHSEYK